MTTKNITPKQQDFIRSLAAQTGAYCDAGWMIVNGTTYTKLDLDAALEGDYPSWKASKIIDVLLAAPKVIDVNAATTRQKLYIQNLAKKAGREVSTKNLTKKEASALIEELISAAPMAA